MASNRRLPDSLHGSALAEVRVNGREALAKRVGVSVSSVERALALAPLSPLVLRAFEAALASRRSSNDTAATREVA